MTRIILRRDKSVNWVSGNPVLHQGEIGVDLTTGSFRIGDGVKRWTDLEVFTPGGPQGEPGPEAQRVGNLISGISPPTNRSVLDPVVDGWGWGQTGNWWIGPAYEVTWGPGEAPDIPSTNGLSEEIDVYVSSIIGSPMEAVLDPGRASSYSSPGGSSSTPTLDSGSGIIFMAQFELGWGGPTVPPIPDLDVLDYLGPMVAGEVVPWQDDPGVGEDGDYYIDRPAGKMYGPRINGVWPSGFTLAGRISDTSGSGFAISLSGLEPTDRVLSLWGRTAQTAALLEAYDQNGNSPQFQVGANGQVVISPSEGLPPLTIIGLSDSDPGVPGQVWNDNGTLKVSM